MNQVFASQNAKKLCAYAKEKCCNELKLLLEKSNKNFEKCLWNY